MPSKKTAKKLLKKAVKKTKRKMNEFMTLLNKARKNKMPEFKYKGKTYKKGTTKTGLVIYKSKK
tara:strand:+ start:5457 stop:5648 length:192 start_codon:yes stop_codon:yes gene_type:complete